MIEFKIRKFNYIIVVVTNNYVPMYSMAMYKNLDFIYLFLFNYYFRFLKEAFEGILLGDNQHNPKFALDCFLLDSL